MEIKYDIFISYSHCDELFAEALEKSLLSHTLSLPISFKKKNSKYSETKQKQKATY